MNTNDPSLNPDVPENQTELEKLLKQKQLETEALKRLVHVLGKLDQQGNEQQNGKS